MPPYSDQKLDPRREAFARAVAVGVAPADAYISAGYAPAHSVRHANRLVQTDRVSNRIKELRSQTATMPIVHAGVTREWVTSRLMELVDRCMQKIPVVDANGAETGTWKFNSTGAATALRLLGIDLGMFVERAEVTRTVDFNRMTRADLERMVEELESVGQADAVEIEGREVLELGLGPAPAEESLTSDASPGEDIGNAPDL